jgi:ATP phosphoribosyltransferase
LFQSAGLTVRRASPRVLRAGIDLPGVERVVFCKPREIPLLVGDGIFDFGLTGTDWIEETGAKIEVVYDFQYSKTTSEGWRVVLAVPQDHPARTVADLGHGVRVATEYPTIARQYFRQVGRRAKVVHSYGSTEAKIPELADAVLEVVETGTSLRHNGLRELETVRRCGVQVIAGPSAWADPALRSVVEQVVALLRAAQAGTNHVLLTIAVPAGRWPDARALLPARWWRLGGPSADLVVVQAAFGESGIAATIAELTSAGAVQIVETPIRKLMAT